MKQFDKTVAIYFPTENVFNLVQEALLKEGYKWFRGNDKRSFSEHKPFIAIFTDKDLVQTNNVIGLPEVSIPELELKFDNWYLKAEDLTEKQKETFQKVFNITLTFYYNHYGIPKGESRVDFIDTLPNNAKLITFDEFETLYIKPENRMKKNTVTKTQLLDLYNSDNCSDWKNYIKNILVENVLLKDNDEIEVKSEWTDKLLSEGSKKQKDLVSKLGIELKEEIEIEFNPKDKYWAFFNNNASSPMLGLRVNESNLKGFWLSKDYDWEIKTDNEGLLVLVPSYKR